MTDGCSLNIDHGLDLQVLRTPGQDKPWLGVRAPGAFIPLAEFISQAEADYLTKLLERRAINITEENCS